MKLVLPLFVIASAAAHFSDPDEGLALLQFAASKHKGKAGGVQSPAAKIEAEEAKGEAGEAINVARQALSEAAKAKEDAKEAQAKSEPLEVTSSIEDQASATGDPHLSQANGAHKDLCCTGSVCKACPLPALVQQSEDVEGIEVSKGAKHRGGQAPDPLEEAKGAKKEANGATRLAKEALVEANKAKGDANKASEDADKEAEPAMEDEAAATGDPHLTQAIGAHRELCCSGSVCKACPYPAALVQQTEDEIKKNKGHKHSGRGSEVQTPAKQEADQAKQEASGALTKARGALSAARKAESDAKKASSDADQKAAGGAGIDDEAEATGDPHLTLSNGNKEDLCCHDGHCKPC
jgi:hypothetical protein